jgi:hypothetical protein
VGAGEVDDHLRGILGVMEGVDQLLVGGEEDLSGDRVERAVAVGVEDPVDVD